MLGCIINLEIESYSSQRAAIYVQVSEMQSAEFIQADSMQLQ